MKALVIHAGDLQIAERPTPTPAAGEVLVRVRAAGLNRADLLQRRGRYPAPPGVPADIPGLELAGEVAACGEGVTTWRVGQRVFGVVAGGAQAEYAVTRADALAAVPDTLSWEEAGGVPEAFITAHDALLQARLAAGNRVLIHAVGSGVGLAAVQLVRAFDAIPYGTARTAAKIDRARGYGLEDGVVVQGDTTVIDEAVARWTGGQGIDVTLDLVGGDYLTASIRAAARRGRIMLIGSLGGPAASVPVGMVLAKRLTLIGTTLRARSAEEKAAATEAFAEAVVPLLADGRVTVPIDSVHPVAAFADAYARLESNASFGKVVLTF